jgi:VanZ family protein
MILPDMTSSSRNQTKLFVLYWLPVILYCVLIFIQSSYPATQSLPRFPHADKLVHAGAYTLLGFLFFRAFQTTRIHKGVALLVMLSALASSVYGISDELHQYFVPSRTASIADVLADGLGSIIGALAAQIILNRS